MNTLLQQLSAIARFHLPPSPGNSNTWSSQTLRNEFHRLPGTFRVVMTSRPEEGILAMLLDQRHVRLARIDLDNANNLIDIRAYIEHRASLLAQKRSLLPEDNCLPNQMLSDVVRKAEGLFQWASVVFDYLETLRNPLKQLQRFLSNPALSGASPE